MKKGTIKKEASGYVVHVERRSLGGVLDYETFENRSLSGAFDYQTMGPFTSRKEAVAQRVRLLAVSDRQYDRIYDDLSRDYDVRFTMGGISITNRTFLI